MKHKMRVSILGIIVIFSTCLGYADPQTVDTFVLEANPFYFKDEAGQWQGIDVEINEALLKAAGYRPTWVNVPWNRALVYLESGGMELMGRLSKTPEREVYIHYLGVYMYEQAGIVVKKENINLKLETLDDLVHEGYLWGIRDKSFYSKEFNHRLENDPEFSRYFQREPLIEMTMRKVQGGRTTGCFRDRLAAVHTLRTNPEFKDLIFRTVPFLPPTPVYLGVSRKMDLTKRARLQQAFDKLSGDGTFKSIVNKWLQ